MARSRYTSIQEIINLTPQDLRALTTAELRNMAVQLNSAANKRIKRIETSKQYSPAIESMFGSRGKKKQKPGTAQPERRLTLPAKASRRQAVSAIRKARDFLSMKTSTVKGAKQYQRAISQKITGSETSLEDLPLNKQKAFWKKYRRLETDNPGALQKVGSDVVQSLLFNAYTDKDRNMTRNIQKAYKEIDEYLKAFYEFAIKESDKAAGDDYRDVAGYEEDEEDEGIRI